MEKAVDAHDALALELGESGEGVAGARRGGAALRAAAAAPAPASPALAKPTSSISRAQQVGVEAERGRQRRVDRIVAAGGADLVGVAGQAVGEVDAQPVRGRGGGRRAPRRADRRRRRASRRRAAEAPASAGRCGPRSSAARQRWASGFSRAGTNRSSAPRRTPQAMERVAVGLVEQRRSARACARRGRTPPASASIAASARTPGELARSRSGDGEGLQRLEVAVDRRVEPGFEPGAQARRGAAPTAGRARARCAARARAASGPGARRARTWPSQPTARPPLVFDDQREVAVGRVEQRLGAAVELVAQAALGGGEQQALVGQPGGRDRRGNRSRSDGRSARARR